MNPKNILIKLATITIIAIILQMTVLLTESKAGIWSTMYEQASNFMESGQENFSNTTISETEVQSASKKMYRLLLGIATAVAVIIGGILGIKFLIASAEDKAEIKQAMIAYVVGCVVVFGAFAIWRLVVNLLQQTV